MQRPGQLRVHPQLTLRFSPLRLLQRVLRRRGGIAAPACPMELTVVKTVPIVEPSPGVYVTQAIVRERTTRVLGTLMCLIVRVVVIVM